MVNRIEFNQLESFDELVRNTMGLIEQAKERIDEDTVLPTYYPLLDTIIKGFEVGKLTAIVGRPSMGKSLFTMNIVRSIVSKKVPVLVFSLSLCKEEWTKCLLCSLANVDLHKTRIGKVNADETVRLNEVAKEVSTFPLYLRDEERKLADIIKVINESSREKGIQLVVIDGMSDIYGNTLQTIKSRGRRYDNQLKLLKELAEKLNLPIVITQNLSRRVEREPHLLIPKHEFGITEGNLSSHASRILHIYREEYYRPKKSNKGVMCIRIPAMKYGECNTGAILDFDRETGIIKEF